MTGRLGVFLQLGWITRWRVSGYACVLLAASLASLPFQYGEAMGPGGSDFLAFWSAGRLVAQGDAAHAYDLAATGAVQAALGRHDVFAFVNPPPMLLVVWPLGYLPYPAAWVLWVVFGWLGWALLAQRQDRRLRWPAAAYPGALIAATHAQTGFLTSALQQGMAQLLGRRPFAAGLCLGALVIKPHLAVLVPLALLAGRHWRAIFGAAAAACGLTLAIWVVFGSAALLAYCRGMAVSSELMRSGDADFFLRQVTVYSAFRAWGLPDLAIAAQLVASLFAAVVVWRGWRGDAPLEGKLALLFAATPLATPYLFSYDLPFLIVPTMWLVGQAIAHGTALWERPMLLLLYLSPYLTRAFALPLHANLMPWASLTMIWMIHRRLAGRPVWNCRPGAPAHLQPRPPRG